MNSIRLSCALALLCSSSASAAWFPVTTGQETDTDDLEPSLLIVAPTDGSTFQGTPDATIEVIAEYGSGYLASIDIVVDFETHYHCAFGGVSQCFVDITLPPATYSLSAMGYDMFDNNIISTGAITIEVVAGSSSSGSSSGDTSGGSSGGVAVTTGGGTSEATTMMTGDGSGTEGETLDSDSDGASGSTPQKGCVCGADTRPGSALAVFCGLVALGRRRRRLP